MGRLVRVTIYAIILLVLYYFLSVIISTYQKKSDSIATTEVMTDTMTLDSPDAIDMLADTLDTGTLITNEDIVDGKINYEEVDEKINQLEQKKKSTSAEKKIPEPETVAKSNKENKSSAPNSADKPAVKPKSPNQDPVRDISPPSVVKGEGGPYMVMAGSYLLKENAVKMVKKLAAMGYTQAEVVVFQASEYHSVVAARYQSESKAQAASSALKQKGIDSFVKTTK